MQEITQRVVGHSRNYLRHKNEVVLPALGVGSSVFSGIFGEGPVSDQKASDLLQFAFGLNMNYIDTAAFYGNFEVEKQLGRVLSNPTLQQCRISTKCGRFGSDKQSSFNFSRRGIIDSVSGSFDRLRRDSLDVVFVHDIEFADLNQIVEETVPTLFDDFSSKQVKCVGLSSMCPEILDYVTRKCAINGYDIDAWITYNCASPAFDTLPLYRSRMPSVVYGGFTLLGLFNETVPSWHPAPEIYRRCARQALEAMDGDREELLRLFFGYVFDKLSKSKSDFFGKEQSSGETVSDPLITSIVASFQSTTELEQVLTWAERGLDEKDWTTISRLQTTAFAPILNKIWVNTGTEENLAVVVQEKLE